jgi:glycosyltransferase involved in cell wall biosynthesis
MPWRLNRLCAELAPDLVQGYGLSCLRTLSVVAPRLVARTVVRRVALEDWNRVDLALLRGAHSLAALTEWEAARLRQKGISGRAVTIDNPFAAWASAAGAADGVDAASSAQRTASVLALARLEQRHAPRDAIWTTDILGHALADVRLDLVGEGVLASNLREFRARVYFPGRTRFVPSVPDVFAALRQARVCWIPSRPGHGILTAMEAHAAGCPLVAYDQPALREIVRQGETGFLIPPGDVVALARRTYALLTDEAMRWAMSTAAAVVPRMSVLGQGRGRDRQPQPTTANRQPAASLRTE